MSDYEPLDLTDVCNAPGTLLGDAASRVLGDQVYRGLPFTIGDVADGQVALLGDGGHDADVRVEIGRMATTMTFAHVLLESSLHRSGVPGETVAVYGVEYADGLIETFQIRERFEIGWLVGDGDLLSDMRSPGAPFLAQPDTDEGLLPRESATRGSMGRALTEVDLTPRVQAFYLFAWCNPRPDAVINAIEFRPTRRRVVVGGVCLGSVDEDPLRRTARRSVLIELPNRADADAAFDLSVSVDRGVEIGRAHV
mgnify:CR=1 FL=1